MRTGRGYELRRGRTTSTFGMKCGGENSFSMRSYTAPIRLKLRIHVLNENCNFTLTTGVFSPGAKTFLIQKSSQFVFSV